MKTQPPYLFFLIFLLPLLTRAQSSHPAFRHYTTDDGLPSYEVYEVLQDRRGYLWFGTDHGASRFNGYEFENFGAERGLKDNVVFYLQEDHQGRIWMVSMSERLYYYDYTLDSILAYEHNDIIQEHQKGRTGLLGFHVDSRGTVYRSLYGQGIIKIEPEGLAEFIPGKPWEGSIMIEVAGQYFYSQRDALVTDSLPFAYYNDRGLRQYVLESDYKGTVNYWLSLTDYTVLVYVNRYIYAFKNGTLHWARPELDFSIISAWQSPEGVIYLGGLGKGVRIYNNEEELRNNTYSSILPGYSVSHIFRDHQGGYWFTTTQDGVFYAPELHFNVSDRSSGFPDENLISLQIQGPDTIWIATKEGNVFWIDRATDQLTPLSRAWGSAEVFNLTTDTRGNLCIATGAGTYQLDATGKVRQLQIALSPTQKPIHAKQLLFSKIDTQRVFLSGSYGFLKSHIDRQEIELRSKDLAFYKRITTLFEDRRGRVWIGTPGGLYNLQGDTAVVPINRHPNMSLRVEDLAELEDGTLVIGTKGAGLLLWKENNFREVGVEQGLVSGMVENLHIDSVQHIWVGTFEGVSKVAPDLSVENYTIMDGLPSNEIMDIDSDGPRVWAATRRGLVEITSKKSMSPPPPFLEEIRVNDEPFRPEAMRKLPYAQNNVQLTYLAIDYTQNGRIMYRYRLQPEASWAYSRNRTVNYAALEWGGYQFEVQARNKDGLWSDSAYLPFSIRPPLWAAWWFWGLIVLAVGFTAYLFYRSRLRLYRQELAYRQIQLEREKERAATEKSISELQASALRAQMNPHFIFNCLNSIQSFIAAGDKTEASRHLARFARLVRGVLRASLESRISLEEEVDMLENYLALEQMRFDRRFSYQVDVAEDIDKFEITIPPLLVQPFVENAIVHGLVEKQKEGRVGICYRLEENHLQITVTDNGIGLTAARERKKNQPSLYKSVGMTLTQKRLELLDQTHQQEAVKVEERRDENGVALGTRVFIRVAV